MFIFTYQRNTIIQLHKSASDEYLKEIERLTFYVLFLPFKTNWDLRDILLADSRLSGEIIFKDQTLRVFFSFGRG